MKKQARCRLGVTLVELVVVLAVLAVLAGMVAPLLANLNVTMPDGRSASPQQIVTEASMRIVRDAILGTADRAGYVADMSRPPVQIRDLFVDPTGCGFDPNTRCGWQGPYVTSNGQFVEDPPAGFAMPYGTSGDPAVLDAWARPLVLHATASTLTVVSAGRDRVLFTGDDIRLIIL